MSIPSSSASVVMTAEQLAAHEPALELAALLRRVAGAVGDDEVGELRGRRSATIRATSSTARRDLMKQIVRAPRRARWPTISAASASDERRVPSASSVSGGFHIAISRARAGRAVAVDERDLLQAR